MEGGAWAPLPKCHQQASAAFKRCVLLTRPLPPCTPAEPDSGSNATVTPPVYPDYGRCHLPDYACLNSRDFCLGRYAMACAAGTVCTGEVNGQSPCTWGFSEAQATPSGRKLQQATVYVPQVGDVAQCPGGWGVDWGRGDGGRGV